MYDVVTEPSSAGEALSHHTTACALGEQTSCVTAAALTVQADDTGPDERQAAVKQLETLCEQDTDLGCFESRSASRTRPRGSAFAAVLYRAVCDHDAPRGC